MLQLGIWYDDDRRIRHGYEMIIGFCYEWFIVITPRDAMIRNVDYCARKGGLRGIMAYLLLERGLNEQ